MTSSITESLLSLPGSSDSKALVHHVQKSTGYLVGSHRKFRLEQLAELSMIRLADMLEQAAGHITIERNALIVKDVCKRAGYVACCHKAVK